MERNYDFQKRMLKVHPDAPGDVFTGGKGETVIEEDWVIVYPAGDGPVLPTAARDLSEYLEVSQRLSVPVRESGDITAELASPAKKLILTTARLTPRLAPAYNEPAAYRIEAGEGIVVCGNSDRGAAQGVYHLEDQMSFRRGPALPQGRQERRPLFSPRMVHSGYALDQYPDEHLRAIAHQGMDAILIFVKAVNTTPFGYLDFNDLISRASRYGLYVYAYSYFVSEKHPDEPDAREHYESTYGALFRECPGLRGVILVGESMEFPSKDPHTTGRPYYEKTPENNPEGKPSPGWYPCYDYPQWLRLLQDVIHSHKPDADIVFWTYNWGYVDREPRLALIDALPEDVTLQATFEMFEKFEPAPGIHERCVDYTLSFEGPGKYFASEAERAKERGLRLYTMCNTGGLTWDVGVIPYEPAPYQWQKRFDALLKAREQWGLSGLMESHHYGFWPSFVSELAKNAFWEPSVPLEEFMRRMAARDFGEENADMVLTIWKHYSDGIRKYIPTNEDQYGPFRIGPAYPLLFLEKAVIPSSPTAHFGGNAICNPMYSYPANRRAELLYEIESIGEMRELYREGNVLLERLMDRADGAARENARRLLTLGRFIENTARTVVHVKQWYLLKSRLVGEVALPQIWAGGTGSSVNASEAGGAEDSQAERAGILEEMRSIVQAEIENAKQTIPLVEFDSRLGFEPSMEYMCDREHLEWKIEQTERALAAAEQYV